MKKSTKLYALGVSAIGISLGVWCVIRFFAGYRADDLLNIISLTILLFICRCFPLLIREGTYVDMSFISILTIFLVEGPVCAAALYLLTTPFVVKPSIVASQRYSHIFNTHPIKTLFNTSNLIITIVVSGFFFNLTGGADCSTQLPECLPPIAVYVFSAMVVNTLLMAFLMHIDSGEKITTTTLMGFTQFMPNIICAVPIGYFLAYLMNGKQGAYLMLLFMLPLMLARFSFKLYLDSKAQSYKVINALSAAIEVKDPYTVGHSKRVEQYSELIARELHLPERKIYRIKIAALFHDIGKIGINDSILNKPGALTNEEYDVIKTHPQKSVHILEDIDFYGDIKDIIIAHHERYDGAGYPNSIKDGEIPFEAAIIAVADSFDAMTSDRPYRKGFEMSKAIAIIVNESGKQFNPQAAEAMESVYKKGLLDKIAK